MVNSILGTGPYINEAMAVAETTMTCIMGRESAYSGQKITWDQIMKSQLDLQPKAFDYKLKMDVPPLPVPGAVQVHLNKPSAVSHQPSAGCRWLVAEGFWGRRK